VYIIDRRLNPKGKNIGNRQRFIRRARAEISKVVQEASSRRNVADIGQGDRVVIPSHGLKEPLFRKAQSTDRRKVAVAVAAREVPTVAARMSSSSCSAARSSSISSWKISNFPS